MPRVILAFVSIFSLGILPLFSYGQATVHHTAQIDRVWQLGSCNCYIFSISLWEFTTEDQMQASQRLHNFKVMNGTECLDLKDPDQLLDMNSTISLKEVDVNTEFHLRPADMEAQRQLKDLVELYPYKDVSHQYEYVSIRTSIFSSELSSDEPAIFAISLLRNQAEDSDGKQVTADIHFYQEGAGITQ